MTNKEFHIIKQLLINAGLSEDIAHITTIDYFMGKQAENVGEYVSRGEQEAIDLVEELI